MTDDRRVRPLVGPPQPPLTYPPSPYLRHVIAELDARVTNDPDDPQGFYGFGRCDRCGESFRENDERAEVVERSQWVNSPAEAAVADHLTIHVSCIRDDDVLA